MSTSASLPPTPTDPLPVPPTQVDTRDVPVDPHAAIRDQLVEQIKSIISGKQLDAGLVVTVIGEAVTFVRSYNATENAKIALITDAFNIVLDATPISAEMKNNMKVLGAVMIPDIYQRYSAPVDDAVSEVIEDVKKKGCCTML